jgi:hypothetical protein
MEVKARGSLVVAAAAVLIALSVPAGAVARPHRRHVEVRQPTSSAHLFLGDQDGYDVGMAFEEPGFAVLYVDVLDQWTQGYVETTYGAHLRGSLARGKLRARFGSVGSVSLRFRPDGKLRRGHHGKNCEGPRPRREGGHFIGRISLRGEGDYFAVSARRASGELDRTFRTRCHVQRQRPQAPEESLGERVAPSLGFFFGTGGGSLAMVEAQAKEHGRGIGLRAAHMEGSPPGAEVEAGTFEYKGRMPVGREASVPQSPAGTLVTTLPGEHPAVGTLKPGAPFTGEAEYIGTSPASHSWTGSLAVKFPGLVQPLAGPVFASAMCVSSPLRDPIGCDFQLPDWQMAESSERPDRMTR